MSAETPSAAAETAPPEPAAPLLAHDDELTAALRADALHQEYLAALAEDASDDEAPSVEVNLDPAAYFLAHPEELTIALGRATRYQEYLATLVALRDAARRANGQEPSAPEAHRVLSS